MDEEEAAAEDAVGDTKLSLLAVAFLTGGILACTLYTHLSGAYELDTNLY